MTAPPPSQRHAHDKRPRLRGSACVAHLVVVVVVVVVVRVWPKWRCRIPLVALGGASGQAGKSCSVDRKPSWSLVSDAAPLIRGGSS